MSDFGRHFVREPATSDADEYARRVHWLAAIYVVLFFVSIVGVALLTWRGKFFVTLAQRSNVETLTIAFFLVFFAYIAALSARGALGAVRLGAFAAIGVLRGRDAGEAALARAFARQRTRRAPSAALSFVVEREEAPGQGFAFRLEDAWGYAGEIRVDAARVAYHGHGGSNNLLAYFAHQVQLAIQDRYPGVDLDPVHWEGVDDESQRAYLGMVAFAQNLRRAFDLEELWPRVSLDAETCDAIAAQLRAVTPSVRAEAFLPDLEYTAEHKLPIIPEPLGIASLSRSERRADPVATMGLAAIVVSASVAVIAYLLILPPWVPGT